MDPEFRELLFSEPDKAVAEYHLDEDEIASLKGIDREKFDAVATGLEERISRAGFTLQVFRPELGPGPVQSGRIRLDPQLDSFFDVFRSEGMFKFF